MNYAYRIKTAIPIVDEHLWQLLEHGSTDSASAIVDALELAVTQGYFGLASEISDALEADFPDALVANPELRSRVLTERMKRWTGMGYRSSARRAASRVIAHARGWFESENTPSSVHALRTGLGYLAWLTDIPTDLYALIQEARLLDEQLDPNSVQCVESRAFTRALEGRLAALQGDAKGCNAAFQEAIDWLSESTFLRSRAHALVLQAEHLVMVGELADALAACKTYLAESTQTQLRSHLVFRALSILIRNGSELSSPAKRALELRWHTLLHAMGLSQSLPAYPHLAIAAQTAVISPFPNLFSYDLQADLSWWLGQLSPGAMERVIDRLYRFHGYQVDLLGGSTPALDLVATLTGQAMRPTLRIGVQVKRWKNPVNKDDIPRIGDFERALEEIRSRGHASLNSLHWYCAAGLSTPAQVELRALAARVLGVGCTVLITDLNDLVGELVATPLILPHLLLSTTLEESTREE